MQYLLLITQETRSGKEFTWELFLSYEDAIDRTKELEDDKVNGIYYTLMILKVQVVYEW